MPSDTAETVEIKPQGRSRITNGSLGVDGRGRWARRFRDLLFSYAKDLGGDEVLTEMQRSMIRRASALTCELERAEVSFATAGKADGDALSAYQTTAGQLRRILESLGLNRPDPKAKPTGKTIDGTADKGGFIRWDEFAQANGIGVGEMDPTTIVHARSGEKMTDNEFSRRIHAILYEAARADAKGEPIEESAAQVFQLLGLTPETYRRAYNAKYPNTRWGNEHA